MTSSTSQQSPRILLVSHNFPPVVGPESSLVHLNALSLFRAGMDVTVLTTSHKFKHPRLQLDNAPLKELPPEMRVMRTASYDAVIKGMSPRLGGLTLRFMESTFLPESYFMWLPTAVPAGRQHLARSPSIIYSRAQKHVSNVCGWRLKRATGLPWIAHFSDLWSGSHYVRSPVREAVTKALERRILRDADKVIFVTQKSIDHVMPAFPAAWRPKVSVVPHGFARELPSPPPKAPGSSPLHLLHAGVFYPRMRTPETLFKALGLIHQKRSLKGRVHLTLLGGEGQSYLPLAESLGVAELVEFKAAVSHAEAQRLISESDLPVMIDTLGYGGVFLPSKLIEYFSFQKPVLALTEQNSAVSSVLKDCGLPMADLTDAVQTAGVLEGFLHSWETNQWDLSAATRRQMAGFQIDRVNQPLVEIMHELTAQAPETLRSTAT